MRVQTVKCPVKQTNRGWEVKRELECLNRDESRGVGLQNFNDKMRHSVANQTQQQAGGTSKHPQAQSLENQEQRSTCMCEPPTDGWEVLGRCVFLRRCLHQLYVYERLCEALRGAN